ncbi:hypothetical protein [Micromonospora cathayae]|uniref:DUF4304 domain-containing protein n=1 Tax=Micromonospora cathayae TaxID=3028804 RepID=A0ABY7ZUJ4_9ACTN|nr:hypothetical protein [Micromonospora sp. HUAS 3]WDZ86690.1 hypothetical protein PVK37_09985 [Micromonospora sp. HUAS 3]
MPDRAATTRLVAAAARQHLQPLGLHRRGASRVWFDDRGWWLIVVEFQPSRSHGTYLNVGAMWLWDERDYWSFDDGSRIYWRDDATFVAHPPIDETGWASLLGFVNTEQFTRDMDMVAGIAAQRVEQLRGQFPDPAATSRQLASRPAGHDESPWWHAYHLGCAAALADDPGTARHAFRRITVSNPDTDWAHDLARHARHLADLADDPHVLRQRVIEVIHATRQRLKLPNGPC